MKTEIIAGFNLPFDKKKQKEMKRKKNDSGKFNAISIEYKK